MADTGSTGEQYAARITALVAELTALIEQAPDDHWTRPPAADAWQPAEVCGHVAEMLPYWAALAAELAASPGMSIGRELHDPRRLAGPALGAQTARADAVTALHAAAETAGRRLRALPPAAWTIEGRHISRGPLTIETMITDFVIDHLAAHIAQTRAALGLPGGHSAP